MIYGLLAGLVAGWLVAKSDKPKQIKYRRVTRRNPYMGRYKPSLLMKRYNKILDKFDRVTDKMLEEQEPIKLNLPTIPPPPQEPEAMIEGKPATLDEYSKWAGVRPDDETKKDVYIVIGEFDRVIRYRTVWVFVNDSDKEFLPDHLQDLLRREWTRPDEILRHYDTLKSSDQKLVTVALRVISDHVKIVSFWDYAPISDNLHYYRSSFERESEVNHE